MFLLQPEELDLLIKRLPSVKVRTADDLFDVLQGEFQFPEEQDLLQGLQRRIVIQPVPCLRIVRRMKRNVRWTFRSQSS